MSEPDERPWEQPWVSRRDCEPHRARLLDLCGTVCLFYSLIMPLASCGCLGPLWLTTKCDYLVGALLFFLPGFIRLSLGLLLRSMAKKDLDLMRGGMMDSEGRQRTERVCRRDATAVLAINAAYLLILLIVRLVWLMA